MTTHVLHLQIRQASTREVSSVVANPLGSPGSAGQSVNVRGQWQSGVSYLYRDIVYNNGSSYICKLTHTSGASTEPGVGASWQTVWDGFAASPINDGTVSSTATWSSDKISTELAGKADNSHEHSGDDLITGTIRDALIPASAVVQHTGEIDHNQLLNYSVEQHRVIDDGSVSNTALWSAAKIVEELANKSSLGHKHSPSDIISGLLDPSLIPQSGVTQHQGAIDHGSIGGRSDNDHTQYVINAIAGGMYPGTAYGVPPQNTIQGGTAAHGLLSLKRNDSFGSLPIAQIELFTLYSGTTLLGGWIDSNGRPIGGTGNPTAPSGEYWFWDSLFVLGSDAQVWFQDQRAVRFYEAKANGTYYISLKSPANLAGLIDYTLPSAPTEPGMGLSVGYGGGDTGSMYWESRAGSAFPTTNLYNGRVFYRTDLGESFVYDDGTAFGSPVVARWISTELDTFILSKDVSSAFTAVSTLNLGDAAPSSATVGRYLETDYFLVGANVTASAEVTGDLRVYSGNAQVATVPLVSSTTNSLPRDKSNWVALSSGDIVWADFNHTGGTLVDPTAQIFLKRFIPAD